MLVRDNPTQFCVSVLHQADWKAGGPLVIDGLRHVSVREILRKLVAPAELRIVYVGASAETRAERLTTQSGETSTIEHYDRHDVESEVEELKLLADLVIDGESDADEAKETVIGWARAIARR